MGASHLVKPKINSMCRAVAGVRRFEGRPRAPLTCFRLGQQKRYGAYKQQRGDDVRPWRRHGCSTTTHRAPLHKYRLGRRVRVAPRRPFIKVSLCFGDLTPWAPSPAESSPAAGPARSTGPGATSRESGVLAKGCCCPAWTSRSRSFGAPLRYSTARGRLACRPTGGGLSSTAAESRSASRVGPTDKAGACAFVRNSRRTALLDLSPRIAAYYELVPRALLLE